MDFEEINIIVERRRDCDTFYIIWSNGMVTFCSDCESSTLNREFDTDSVKKVIEILGEAIGRVKRLTFRVDGNKIYINEECVVCMDETEATLIVAVLGELIKKILEESMNESGDES